MNGGRSLPDPAGGIPLDRLPMGVRGEIAAIAWDRIDRDQARRLREMGFDVGVAVELLHEGPIGRDPIACSIGRMTVAIRRALASVVLVAEMPGS